MVETLGDLGMVVDHPAQNTYEVAAGDVDWLFVPLEAAAKMRASFILLGPLLARFGRVIISNPGGDRIGRRPVNLHVDAMRAMGAEIEYRNGYYFARSPGRFRGAHITFPTVTVMGTENALLAATLADGHTTIQPAAQEPEVDDLIGFLQQMGAEVERTAPDTIEVEGRRRLRGAEHQVIADRIEAGTFVVAAAVTGGEVTLTGAPSSTWVRSWRSSRAWAWTSSPTGTRSPCAAGDPGRTRGGHHHRAIPGTGHRPPVTHGGAPDPGDGTSHIHETIFEDRLEWMEELRRMGASVDIPDAHHAYLQGPVHAARRGGRDERPAGGCLAHAGRPCRRRHQPHPRRPPGPPRV